MMELVKLIIALGFAHAIADLALQTEWVGKYKSPIVEYNMHGVKQTVWPVVLLGHSMINGAVYYLFTGSLLIGILETIAHFIIDYHSSSGHYGLLVDQLLHGACLILWAYILLYHM